MALGGGASMSPPMDRQQCPTNSPISTTSSLSLRPISTSTAQDIPMSFHQPMHPQLFPIPDPYLRHHQPHPLSLIRLRLRRLRTRQKKARK